MSRIKTIMILILFTACPVIISCGPGFDVLMSPSENVAFILTTDYTGSGSFSTVELDTLAAYNDIGAGLVHTDAYCRSFGGYVYVVNAKGRNNIQVIDPDDNFSTVREISVKEDAFNDCNPHDIVPCGGDRACVTRYDDTELWIIDLATGVKESEINIADYKYTGSAVPHMHTMYYDESTSCLFVALQRLDSIYKPSDYSSVLVIDTSVSPVTVQEIKLYWNEGGGDIHAKNPISHFRKVSPAQLDFGDGNDHLLISCVGSFAVFGYAEDGGIIAIDMTDLEVEPGFILAEADIHGEVNDFVITPSGKGYAVVSDSGYRTKLIEFSPASGSIVKTIRENDDSYGPLGSLALRESTEVLFYGDRRATNPGVRVYDTVNDEPLNGDRPVNVGLPPAGICIVE